VFAHEVFVGGDIIILFFFFFGGLRAFGFPGFLPGRRLQWPNQSAVIAAAAPVRKYGEVFFMDSVLS